MPSQPVPRPTADFQSLIVGVGHYHFYTDLPETLKDAQTFYDVLVDPRRCAYPPERVRLQKDATSSDILDGLKWLADNATLTATTLVYFSGHGGFIAGGPSYLCPQEANWQDLAGTAISAQVFAEKLAAIKTPRLVVILDACYSGGMTALKGVKGPMQPPAWKGGLPLKYYEQLAQGEGRVVMASSRANQESLTLPEARLSLFTHYIIKGIKGEAAYQRDGLIHVLDLFSYVSATMHKERPLQDPILEGKATQNFPIALHLGGFHLGKGGESVPSEGSSPFTAIRQQLESPYVDTRLAGAQALLDAVERLSPQQQQNCGADPVDIQTQLTTLKVTERDIRVNGESPLSTPYRYRILGNFFTIIRCLERGTGDRG